MVVGIATAQTLPYIFSESHTRQPTPLVPLPKGEGCPDLSGQGEGAVADVAEWSRINLQQSSLQKKSK